MAGPETRALKNAVTALTAFLNSPTYENYGTFMIEHPIALSSSFFEHRVVKLLNGPDVDIKY